jgi:prevent-host-death family protein
MNNITLNQLASVSDLQRNYTSLLLKVKKLAKPLILLRRNEPEAVLVSVPHYEELVEKKRLYEEQEALKMIDAFEKDKKAGRLLTANTPDDLFK